MIVSDQTLQKRLRKTQVTKAVGFHAFLNVFVGGIGAEASAVHRRLYDAYGRPFHHTSIHIDSDAAERRADTDFSCVISPDPQQLNAIRANADSFPPPVPDLCRELAPLLDQIAELPYGARTTRALTQLYFLTRENHIRYALQQPLHALVEQGNVTEITVCITSSSGGGTGSALQILLIEALNDPHFFWLLTQGLQDTLVHKPLSFVGEPLSLAHRHIKTSPSLESAIMSNACAFRVESASLERQGKVQGVYHLGFSNGNGQVVSRPEDLAAKLGNGLFELQRNWPELKSRLTDPLARLRPGYPNKDIPEFRLGIRDALNDTNASPSED